MKSYFKFKRFHIINFIIYLLIIIMSILSISILNITYKMEDELKSNIEENYRKETRRILEFFSERLHTEVETNNLNIWDDSKLKMWFDNNLLNLRYSGNDTLKMAINVGYSYIKPEECDLNRSNIPNDLQMSFLNVNLNGKTNQQVEVTINELIENKITLIDKNVIKESLKNLVFVKNKVISTNKKIDTDLLSNMIYRMNRSEHGDNIIITYDEGDSWIEWRSVPITYRGFDNQPPDDGENYSYKKLSLVIGINANEAIFAYKRIFDMFNNIRTLISILLILTFICSITILSYKFTRIIKDCEGICGSINKK